MRPEKAQLMRASNEYENDSRVSFASQLIEDNKYQAKLEEFLTNSLGSNWHFDLGTGQSE